MPGVETIARGDDSRLVETRRFLIRDSHAFAAVWAAHAGPDAPVPAVDFASRMVAAVFAGERPTPGYSVEVTGTTREGADLVVVIEERQPDPSRVSAQIVMSPYHIATLPRDDGPVRFTPDPGGQHTIVFKPSGSPAPRAATARSSSATTDGASPFTGLTPRVAATLAYLAGPLSGVLLLATEKEDRFVRFHAWQAIVGLGLLGTGAVACLALAFVMLVVSPTAFWIFLWLAAILGVVYIGAWILCLLHAWKGQRWRLPLVGAVSTGRATRTSAASSRVRSPRARDAGAVARSPTRSSIRARSPTSHEAPRATPVTRAVEYARCRRGWPMLLRRRA
jgi:uncharacterized membrane protein